MDVFLLEVVESPIPPLPLALIGVFFLGNILVEWVAGGQGRTEKGPGMLWQRPFELPKLLFCFLSSLLPVFSKDESERIKCGFNFFPPIHQSMKFSDYSENYLFE